MKNNDNLFWVSYSDIMTSLFFIMLVLFVVTAGYYYNRYQITQDKLNEIDAIETALSSLDRNYFNFNEENKRYRLNIDVRFNPREANINVMPTEILDSLYNAGSILYQTIDSLIINNERTHLLLVIEGNNQRPDNYQNEIDFGYTNSYKRALALFNFWKERGLNFYDFGERCEVIIAGSGYFGLAREEIDPTLNRRFTLQITSKYTLEAGSNI